MKSVSIVIPNWNGEDLLRSYLPSVLEAKGKYPGRSEIIVVDDASTDRSVNLLMKKFPDVKLIAHQQNKGFGQACWSGALAARYPVLMLLNSDVKVDPLFVSPLANCFEDPNVFSASPLIFDEDNEISNETISIPYFRRGKLRYKSFPPQLLLNDKAGLRHPWYTLFPLGGAVALDKERFIALGGFDDLFEPFYYEDTDLGFRAWRRGWQCVVVPEARVTHYHQGTIARSFRKFEVKAIRKRNRLFFTWKNLTATRLLWQHIIFHLLRLCYRPFCLDGMVHVASILAIPGFNKAMRKRRAEKKETVNSEKKIFDIINSAVSENCQLLDSNLQSKIWSRGIHFGAF
jgi:GT2 family glycosyltransferase